ncbi:MAG: polyisoprenoid-binding protein [Bdellovibrionales bacterium]|nr:polyisoprenoid-binding protein [Bdellovibrionales bacterium]
MKGVIRALLGSILVLAAFALPCSAAEYKVDDAHTTIGFSVKHLGISWVAGSFGEFEGSFQFDPKNIKAASAKATIKTKSITTSNAKRDDHLRSADFFNAEQHQEISFQSKEIKDVQGDKFTVVGDLTVNGVTHPVSLDAEFRGAATDPWGNDRAGFTASGKINRKDFGLTWNKLLETGGLVVGEDVFITIEVEGIKEKQS